MSGEMVFEVEAWDDGTICRTRAYSGVRLRNTSIPSSSFPFYPCVIYSICGFKTKVLLHSCKHALVAKFRHADGIAILQCFGCQTPMKCIQCQGVPCGPMQRSILLPCSSVMFLHNKCPTRPPYPCIRLHSLCVCTACSIL